jgi:hypothetical protein
MKEPPMMESQTMEASEMGMPTMRRRRAIIVGAIAALGVVWYLFRPELLFVDKSVDEAFPAAADAMMGKTRAEGMFHSAAHDTKGTATIIELAGGKKVLRLTGFETSNGPDVHVLLGKAADATDNDMVKDAGYVDLGSLKGNIGDQNYDIPADTMLDDFNSVTIWCNRFSVNFGTAPLSMKFADDMMPKTAQPVAMGMFHGVAHETVGTATIHELPGGKQVLRLTGFETSNGPDVHVLLGKATDATDNEMVKDAGYVDLGSLKGNIGDQNYEIPADVNPADFNSVTIWCNRFSVNFGTAPLKMN